MVVGQGTKQSGRTLGGWRYRKFPDDLSKFFRGGAEHKEGLDQKIDRHSRITGFHFGHARLTGLEKLGEFDLRESFPLATIFEAQGQSELESDESFFLR